MDESKVNSAEQVLELYFDALLIEEDEQQSEQHLEALSPSFPETTPKLDSSLEIKAKMMARPSQEKQVTQLKPFADEASDLSDVQKLLDQVNPKTIVNSKTITKPEKIESLIEQNAVSMATELPPQLDESAKKVETKPQPVVELAQIEAEAVSEQISVEQISEEQALVTQPESSKQPPWQSTVRDEAFQVLYFNVYGVTFAVPLDELGGIHRLGELNHLIGRPNWYMGLQSTNENRFNVVDTAKWSMEKRLVGDEYRDSYDYIVILDNSQWGLAADALAGTELLEPSSINWRSQPGKRPWLAGMVKQKMCALIHVSAMIEMLNAGISMSMLKNESKVVTDR